MDGARSRAAKAKGRAAENAVVDYLRSLGFEAERRRLTGANDKGDIAGLPGLAIEVKDQRALTFAAYVDEANVEAANAGVDVGVAWVKRRGKTDPKDWYVVMDGKTFMTMWCQVANGRGHVA